MANEEHLARLKEGVADWNAWRQDNPDVRPDLREAVLYRAVLREAVLTGANLAGAALRRANLIGANLQQAVLTQAGLPRADLTGANLQHAVLRGANFFETIFADTILTDAKGLEECRHAGPSIIDHRTLAKNTNLPKAFLQGCGLPDWLIEAYKLTKDNLSGDKITGIAYEVARLRAGQPFAIQLHSCFISYARADAAFARRLHDDLQQKGVRCWFAPEKMKGGRKLHSQLEDAIRLHDKLLLILSEGSMQSDWVAYEIKQARKREKREGRQMLFPLGLVDYDCLKAWMLFDSDTVTDLASEVRSYFIPDFSRWEDQEAYGEAFGRLLKDLQAG